jgi:Carboxypeptidase regulatory-like domain
MVIRRYAAWIVWLTVGVFPFGVSRSVQAQSQQPPAAPATGEVPPNSSATATTSADDQLPVTRNPDQRLSGHITGAVVDQTGAAIAGARVSLTRDTLSPTIEVLSGDDGEFSLANISPGPFQLTVKSAGFAPQTVSGVLHTGETFTAPTISLILAAAATELRVVPSEIDLAQDQIKDEEKQRVLGVIPNFYVSYVHNAVPLTSKQKFELAWKTTIDPVSFGVNGVIAGVEQAQNDFGGYGQGAQGYAKRYGASYADFVAGTFIGSAILPSLLKQDPRYFYKGTGSKRSRILYAVANAVICKGDNGHWQANYSGILGGLAAGGISNLYYPASDRNGAALTFENTLVGIGTTAVTNLLQEFLIRKLTQSVSSRESSKPQNTIGKILTAPFHEGD